ncbi:aspartate/glutamate racemase family protein [Pseudooceanicola sp. CBS1P-1]|uniref:Asp/Glu/hydantoin racemase n=1 Tax=Pseudooceanicola albus TaxID=2692189 RepID=A0A6L7GCW8_9RHOB|nr:MULTISPECIES: aspartate/glutamate racemase family protein [Pseudooceanicola]MBT9386955.1 aspartate/glutamate racemase family protein [Pseudooceanicola endophyticus]MXN21080.1 Asp/Glu/hydantoin racemase [Pseudooceanicola albus]
MTDILLINPNSSGTVTRGMDRTARAMLPAGLSLQTLDLPDSPATIASDEDVARAGLGVLELARRTPARVVITGCFSDPGLDLLRAMEGGPVAIGCQEAALLSAMARADRFGVIALGPKSIPRHLRKMRMMGIEGRLAGELHLSGCSAEAPMRDPEAYALIRTRAEELGAMGAGAIVLGCAGMAPIRARLEAETGLAIVDPVSAAMAQAIAAVQGDPGFDFDTEAE